MYSIYDGLCDVKTNQSITSEKKKINLKKFTIQLSNDHKGQTIAMKKDLRSPPIKGI